MTDPSAPKPETTQKKKQSGVSVAAGLKKLAGISGLVILLVAGSLLVTDWPFWYRYLNFPEDGGEWPDSFYEPTHAIGNEVLPEFPQPAPSKSKITSDALEAAADWAEDHNSLALLILHEGELVLEKYWQDAKQDSLLTGRAMSRTPISLLIGIGLNEGWIQSLDDPISKYLEEWSNDARGKITIRQLLNNISGLESPAFSSWPYSKIMQMSIGSDFTRTVLSLNLVAPPGSEFKMSNVDAQLLSVIIERANSKPYEQVAEEKLWQPMDAGKALFFMDQDGGTPAAYCCFRTTARSWLRLGQLIEQDGMFRNKQIVPAGWVAQMRQTSSAGENYGFLIWTGSPKSNLREYTPGSGVGVPHSEAFLADDIMYAEGGGFRTLYVIPSKDLVILRLGRADDGWDSSKLPNLILRDLNE